MNKLRLILFISLLLLTHQTDGHQFVESASIVDMRTGYSGVTLILILDHRIESRDDLMVRCGKWYGSVEPLKREVGIIVRDMPATIQPPQIGEQVYFYTGSITWGGIRHGMAK